jgi:uncharacterized protein YjbI with pentapeptide repeats
LPKEAERANISALLAMRVTMSGKPNPFDVEALERSLNDSATRASTIWISFLIFGLYLVVAAGTVTHRQLLLEDPVKLPVLNIELPLAGFFFLAPILFFVLHAYVLIQVLLLGRTAAAYNEALDRVVKAPTDNASMRQRLANTLFAQIFAGSPREREGWLGWLLKMLAWLTLAIAPVLVLLVFQFKFLPYHSHQITWTFRVLIVLDLVAVLILWRETLQSGHGMIWRLVLRSWIALPSAFALTAFSWVVLTFPGEPHAEWTRYWSEEKEHPRMIECRTKSAISETFPSFDRLWLPGVAVVDEKELAKIKKAAADRQLEPHKAKRTRSFRDRDLNCGMLLQADLRGVDLTNAHLRGTNLYWANLEGAVLDNAELQDAALFEAHLEDASLYRADLRSASLPYAHLQRAFLASAQLQGATLHHAQLQGANLGYAQLQGADLSEALLHGARLSHGKLQGASLDKAQFQVAWLVGSVQLQGARLNGADFSGASLQDVGLQGADLSETAMQNTRISATHVWRANNAACTDARVSGQLSDALLPTFLKDATSLEAVSVTVPATLDNIANFIGQSVADISDEKLKEAAIKRMRSGLVVDLAKDDTKTIEEVWRKCEQISNQVSQADFDKKTAVFMRALFCDAKKLCPNPFCDTRSTANAVATVIIRGWISDHEDRRHFSAQVARGLLGEDGKPCAASKELDEKIRKLLRETMEGTTTPDRAPQSARPDPLSPAR